MIKIVGNTFPVKEELKRLGGRWNAEIKAWMVPEVKADAARALVAGTGPARRGGGFRPKRRRGFFCGTCRGVHDGNTICPECGQED